MRAAPNVELTQIGSGASLSTTATIVASGTVTGPGLAGPSPFTGAYTTQFPRQTAAGINAFINAGGVISNKSFSATFIVSAVPEPATVALMGTGLVALLGVGLRRRADA